MKTKTTKITFVFIFTTLVFALLNLSFLERNNSSENFFTYHIIADFIFIIFTGLILRYFIIQNNKSNHSLIEQQKLINAEIQEAKERYDIVAKATSDTVWDWKIVGNEFTWNKGIQGVYGYKKEDIENTSKWWFDRIHPEDSIRMSVKLYSFLEQKTQKWQDEYRFKCKDGHYKYVLDRGFLVIDDHGTPTRMIGAMQDITQKKEEEERLKLLETVITNTKDAVVITDAGGSEHEIPHVVFVNQAFTKMSGFEYNDIVGQSMLTFLKIRQDSSEFRKMSQSLLTKTACEVETLSHKKNDDDYWVKFSMVPVFNSEKEHTHWISIQRDITEQKQQEKEKEQLINELTQNNKDLRQFSYITSHNLRAPLSNLIGLLNLISAIDIEDEELKLIIEGFSKSTLLLNETVADLGKVVIIRDNPSVEKQHIHIKESLDNLLNQINILVQNTNPKIIIDTHNTETIYSNKAYFESILQNLLTNAIKYRARNRELVIKITVEDHPDHTTLYFEDNGIGLDVEKYRDKIFGLYQRFHNYPDSKGLGLYLVKSQIESMGGRIDIESKVDEGTKFIINFKKET